MGFCLGEPEQNLFPFKRNQHLIINGLILWYITAFAISFHLETEWKDQIKISLKERTGQT
jgi:hypothetical protein